MSVINQVLIELEKRGEQVPLGEDTIRAVPPREESAWTKYLLVVLALILLAAAGWYFGQDDKPDIDPAVAAVAPGYAVVPVSSAVAVTASDAVAASGVPLVSGLSPEPAANAIAQQEETAAEKPGTIGQGSVAHEGRKRGESAGGEALRTSIPVKQFSPQQQAENEFNKANLAAQAGRIDEALTGYENALLNDPTFKPARRAWVGLLLNLKRNDEAERVLQRGLRRDPHDADFAMLLARLQVERGAEPLALETLQKNLPDAKDQADYQAFMAVLLQRQARHQEAVTFFQAALRLVPNNGVWLMGMGISLQALQRNEDARNAYTRALGSNSLSAQLQAFVQNKLKEL